MVNFDIRIAEWTIMKIDQNVYFLFSFVDFFSGT